MNPLFRETERAIRQAAAEEFRGTRLGQLAEALSSSVRGHNPPATVKRIVREIGTASRDLSRKVGSMSRYSFLGDMTSGLIDSMKAFLAPITNLVKGLVQDWQLSTGGFGGGGRRPPQRPASASPGDAGGGGNRPPTGTAPPAGGSFDDEIQSAIRFLEANGYTVIPPGQRPPARPTGRPAEVQRPEDLGFTQEPPRTRGPESPRGPMQPGQRINIFGGGLEYDPDDPLFSGEMIEVQSSNVHSIGFTFNEANPSKGTLKVRFLQTSKKNSNRRIAGPLYFYYDVHPLVFQSFRQAGSPGGFVWDRLRIRGTVSGHRYHYELKGIAEGYVPRKATRYGQTEYFIGRRAKFRNQQTGETRMFESQLPDVQVQTLTPPRYGPQGFVPPDRGRPNRGRP